MVKMLPPGTPVIMAERYRCVHPPSLSLSVRVIRDVYVSSYYAIEGDDRSWVSDAWAMADCGPW